MQRDKSHKLEFIMNVYKMCIPQNSNSSPLTHTQWKTVAVSRFSFSCGGGGGGGGGGGHDVIKMFNLCKIQCKFKKQSKDSQLHTTRLAKICRFQIQWISKLKPTFLRRYFRLILGTILVAVLLAVYVFSRRTTGATDCRVMRQTWSGMWWLLFCIIFDCVLQQPHFLIIDE